MEIVFHYNVILDLVGLAIVCVVGVASRQHDKSQVYDRLFFAMSVVISAVLLFDMPAWILDGMTFPGARQLLWLLDSLYYAAQAVFCWLWFLFSVHWSFRDSVNIRKLALPAAVPMTAELALVIMNPWTGWVFTISAANVYSRGALYAVNLIPFALYVGGGIAITLYKAIKARRDEAALRNNLMLLLFMSLPVFAMVLDSLYYGVSCLWPCTALLLMMIYLYTQQQIIATERYRAMQLEQELTQRRIDLMLSQIQPHFLYNALGAIQALCDQDNRQAGRATAEFSEFLRGNMDSLSAVKPIAFERELAHTKNYLSIEQLRFGEYLTVRYDIKTTLFRLPTLTLQPIVENAVRCGVTKKEEGGTVVISTDETDSAYIVTVADDGVGFEPGHTPEDGRSHVGIENVRERLRLQCGGSLTVKSTPGAGTVAVITIPKEN